MVHYGNIDRNSLVGSQRKSRNDGQLLRGRERLSCPGRRGGRRGGGKGAVKTASQHAASRGTNNRIVT